MEKEILSSTAKSLVSSTKGILAADWSLGSSEKHFAKNNIEHTEETRRKFRQMLFTSNGLEEYISGVILFDETIKQKTDDGKTFPQLLQEKGITPGIKVDMGMKDMALFANEKITSGIDGLRERLVEYKNLGAKFTKWRAAIAIGEQIPTGQCILSNAEGLARFAALSQEAGLVPVVEPEVLMDGGHDIAKCEEVTRKVLAETFSALEKHRVYVEGTILKTNYVHPGKDSGADLNYRLFAEETYQTFERTLSPNLPGVVLLSGGIDSQSSAVLLNELEMVAQDAPWQVSFSYGRALLYPAVNIWAGKDENVGKAQESLLKRAKLNSLARQAKYNEAMEG